MLSKDTIDCQQELFELRRTQLVLQHYPIDVPLPSSAEWSGELRMSCCLGWAEARDESKKEHLYSEFESRLLYLRWII